MLENIRALGGLAVIMLIVTYFKPQYAFFGIKHHFTKKKLFMIWGCILVVCSVIAGPAPKTDRPTPSKVTTSTALVPKIKTTGEFEKAANITPEQAKAIEDVIKSLGFSKIRGVEYLPAAKRDGLKVYSVKANDIFIRVALNSNNAVADVYYVDQKMYDNGNIYLKYDDVVLSSEKEFKLKEITDNLILSLLKSPSTAKFPDISEYGIKVHNKVGKVVGYVDAQNSFGATLRSYFVVEYDMDKHKVISLEFDGKKIK